MQIILQVNQRNIEIEVSNLNKQIEVIRKLSECFAKITNSKKISSIENVHQSIRERSGFQHIPTSAKLLELDKELEYIESNLFLIDLSNFNINDDYSDIEIKKEVLEQIKSENTTYLDTEKSFAFTQISKALDILNKINPQYYKSISQDYQGKFQINKMILHNAGKI